MRCFASRLSNVVLLVAFLFFVSTINLAVANAEEMEKTLAEKNRAELIKKLRQPTQFDVTESELQEMVEFLWELHKIPLVIDVLACDEIKVSENSLLTYEADKIPLAKGIKRMLATVHKDLVPIVYAEVVLITTKQEAKKLAKEKPPVYPNPESKATQRLIQMLAGRTQMDLEEVALEEVLEYLEEWHGVEIERDDRALSEVGVGSDSPFTCRIEGVSLDSSLKLSLRQIDLELVATIYSEVIIVTTKEAAAQLAKELPSKFTNPESKETKRLIEVLAEPTQLDFEEVPLNEVLEYLTERHATTVKIDESLTRSGVLDRTPTTLRVRGISLASALNLMLRQIDPLLTYDLRGDKIMIVKRKDTPKE